MSVEAVVGIIAIVGTLAGTTAGTLLSRRTEISMADRARLHEQVELIGNPLLDAHKLVQRLHPDRFVASDSDDRWNSVIDQAVVSYDSAGRELRRATLSVSSDLADAIDGLLAAIHDVLSETHRLFEVRAEHNDFVDQQAYALGANDRAEEALKTVGVAVRAAQGL